MPDGRSGAIPGFGTTTVAERRPFPPPGSEFEYGCDPERGRRRVQEPPDPGVRDVTKRDCGRTATCGASCRVQARLTLTGPNVLPDTPAYFSMNVDQNATVASAVSVDFAPSSRLIA